MPRSSSFLPALVALTTMIPLGAVTTGPAAAAAPVRRESTPLQVTIDALSPSVLSGGGPDRRPIRVTGSVTNTSTDRWVAVNMHAFVSGDPIRTSAELAEEAKRDPADAVGERITRSGSFDTVDSLEPGETAPYSLRLNPDLLAATEPGTYWFGVHAMGDDGTGRDAVADGRARTFLPFVPDTRAFRDVALDAALVVPIRYDIRHEPDGRLSDVDRWADSLSDGGALRTLVDFGASSGDTPLTWLLDPAVPDAVRALVAGNPPRSLDDTSPLPEDPSAEPSEESTSGTDSEPTEETPPQVNPATEPGASWLERLREAIEGDEVHALPYGDLDVSAAATRNPQLYTHARKRSARALKELDVSSPPGVGSPSGYLDPAALDMIKRRSTVVVTDRMYGANPPTVARVSGRTLITSSFSTGEGGPGPDDPLAAVALRQRILGEAAVRALSPRPQPLVVLLPHFWRPASTTGFFSGLDVEWLDLTTLDSIAFADGREVDPERLDYPESQALRSLDEANFDSASALIGRGRTLEEVLLRNDEVAADVVAQALTTLSHAARNHPDSSRAEADRSNRWIGAQLASITVNAPPSVTLSSASGGFSATVSNALEHPVRVRVEAVTDSTLRIEDSSAIDVPAGGQASVPLEASTDRLGVHNVELIVTTEDGTPIGSTDTLPIRPTNVSSVIWLILGTGVALLFGAILVRLVRRVRRARAAA